MPTSPRLVRFANDRGVPGSVVHTRVHGTGLATLTGLVFSGAGVTAQLLGQPMADHADLAVTIAAGAAPGPRAAVLPEPDDGGRRNTGVLFHVLARSSYAGAGGIGSHLI